MVLLPRRRLMTRRLLIRPNRTRRWKKPKRRLKKLRRLQVTRKTVLSLPLRRVINKNRRRSKRKLLRRTSRRQK